MSEVTTLLYDTIVTPLIYLIEMVFAVLYRLLDNSGLAIVGVSLVVNLLCLPLYRMADRLQEEERQKQASMAKWVDHIKKHFKGDEQYMMLTTYYRQQGYKPIQALNSSISLLLQIPIFMAAYNYLSNLSILKGTPFLIFSDLGAPDALFSVGGFTVNVLPIAMTLLNCVSTFIYTKGLGLRDKLQAYGLAMVFLVLLYDSPSGLVMYWTCNQIFSVCKNIVFKRGADAGKEASLEKGDPLTTASFVLAASLIVALLGLLIPSALLSASTAEFINRFEFINPLRYVVHALCVFGGFFLLWVGVFFYLSKGRGRRLFALSLTVLSAVFLVDYFFFGRNLGIITSSLVFETSPSYTTKEILLNIAVLAIVIGLTLFAWKCQRSLVNPALTVLLIAILGLSALNIKQIYDSAESIKAEISASQQEAEVVGTTESTVSEGGEDEAPTPVANASGSGTSDEGVSFYDEDGNIRPLFTLSREGRNVLVLFLDRAISGYLPYIFNEKPELVEAYDGFTYYPNTISFGRFTVFGSSGLYGGYDYSVQAMEERDDELLSDKHNEALQVIPAIFSEAGYDVTLFDPPLVDYKYSNSDYHIFEPYENVHAYKTAGAYSSRFFSGFDVVSKSDFRRNICFYSLFKTVPVFMQSRLYDRGTYGSTSVNHAINSSFIQDYSVIVNLSALTNIDEGNSDNVLILGNTMTHNPDMLQMPNYVPSAYIDNAEFEDYSRFTLDGRTVDMTVDRGLVHYHANISALLRLGEWFDYLREQGVYDNTRIIIVADHGIALWQFEDMLFDNTELDVEGVNPLFMVKDFDAHGFSTSNEFMTNADTPTIAFEGLVDNPVNPFTGNPINSDEKTAHPQLVTTSNVWQTENQSGTTFDVSNGNWYTVHDDIFNEDNWQRVER